jgi:hypothetical protein
MRIVGIFHFPNITLSRIRVLVADPIIPQTHSGQLTSLFSILGAADFASAQAGITQLQNTARVAGDWQTQRQALFASLGGNGDVPEHYDFAASLAAIVQERTALFTALGVNNQADAVVALTNLRSQLNSYQANQTTIFAALGATDLAGAMRAIKDIDGRIEAGVQAGVIARAASAGVPTVIPKVPDQEVVGGAKTCTRAEFTTMNAKQQLEFSQAGGKIVEAQ